MLSLRHYMYTIALVLVVFGAFSFGDDPYFLLLFSTALLAGVIQIGVNMKKTHTDSGVFYRDNIKLVHVMIICGMLFTMLVGILTFLSLPKIIILSVFLLISFGWIALLLIVLFKVAVYEDGKVFIPFRMGRSFYENTYSVGGSNKRAFYVYHFHKHNVKKVYKVPGKELAKVVRSGFFRHLGHQVREFMKSPEKVVCIEFRTPIRFRSSGRIRLDILAKHPELKKIYVSVARPNLLIEELQG